MTLEKVNRMTNIPGTSTSMAAEFHSLDWIVLAGYMLAMILLGASFYKGQKTAKDYFLAGRSMTWFPVGLSLTATIFSAISYMAVPSAIQKYGVIFLLGTPMVFL